jgi:hypothetical protein
MFGNSVVLSLSTVLMTGLLSSAILACSGNKEAV